MTVKNEDQPTPRSHASGRRRALFVLLAVALGSALAAGVAAGVDRARGWWLQREQAVAERAAATRESRVLVVGDSFLDRWPMEHYLAKDMLGYANRHGLGMVVRGYRGWGPFDYRAATNKVTSGGKFQPHLLVVFFYAGNDISDTIRVLTMPLPDYLELPGKGQPARPLPPPPRPRGSQVIPFNIAPLPLLPLLSCSPETNLGLGGQEAFDWSGMHKRGMDPELIRMARSLVDSPRVGDDVVSPSLLSVAVHNPGIFDQNVLLRGVLVKRAGLMARAQLRWMFDEVRLFEADIALVIIPSVVQVTRARNAFLKRARFWVREQMYTSERPQRLLKEFGKAEGVAVLDLLPLLRRHPAPGKLYFKHDTHFNELGNQVVFGLVKERLLDLWLERRQAALAGQPGK